MVIILGYSPLFRKPFSPKAHWSESPIFRKPISPKKKLIGSKAHRSESPLVLKKTIGPEAN